MAGQSVAVAAPPATDTAAAPGTTTEKEQPNNPGQTAAAPPSSSSATQPVASSSNAAAATAGGPPVKPKQAKKAKPKAADAGKANSLAGGLIGTPSNDPPLPGWLLAGGGTRKSLPEVVVPFKLPYVTLSDTPSKTPSESGSNSEEDNESDSELEESSDDASDSDESSGTKAKRKQDERDKKLARRVLEQTYLQTQSLRQSRLFYLASLLPPYSHRAPRSGQVFPASIPSSALHGIDPSAKGSHVLVSLGRFDVEAGPHIFPKTKLWEMRKEAPPSSPKSSRKSFVKQGSPTLGRSRPAAKASAPRPSQSAASSVPESSSANPATAATPTQTPKPKKAASKKAAAASTPSGSPAQQKPTTSAAAGTPASHAATPPVPSATPSSSSPALHRPTPQSPAPPPVAAPSTVDPVLVTRVNMRAAHNPALRELLGVAARGQATPGQLRSLGEVIQEVTREMEAEGLTVQPPRPLPQPQPPLARPPAPLPSQAAPGQSGSPATAPVQGGPTPNVKSDGTPTPAPKKPRKSGGSKKKKEADAAAAKAAEAAAGGAPPPSAISQPSQQSSSSKAATAVSKPETPASSKKAAPSSSKGTASKSAPAATAAPPSPLFRPPILVLEFRENFATRFYVPFWTSIVTRQKSLQPQSEEDYGEEELTEEEPVRPLVEIVEVRLQFLAPLEGSDAAGGMGTATKVPVCMVISGQDPQGMLWEAAGRVPGVKTLDVHGQVVPDEPSNPEESSKNAPPSASLSQAQKTNPLPMESEQGADADIEDLQKKDEEGRQKEEAERQANEEKAQEELQKEREVVRAIAEAILAQPVPTIMDASGPFPPGLEDHLADRFAPAGPSTQTEAPRGAKAPKRRLKGAEKDAFTIATSNAEDSIDLSMYAIDSDGEHTLSAGMGLAAGPAIPKPRKKRNVATHNPDGTLKRCNHCQTNTTPMWRRGPDGPGTLCNACGARWKVGRLGAVPPPKRGKAANAAEGGADAGAGATAAGTQPDGEASGKGAVEENPKQPQAQSEDGPVGVGAQAGVPDKAAHGASEKTGEAGDVEMRDGTRTERAD